MLRTRSFKTLVGSLLFGICVIVMLSFAYRSVNASPQSPVLPMKTVYPYPPGVPAIHPSLQGDIAIATADVQQYIDSNANPLGRTVSGARPTIQKIQFITASQASALLNGEQIGRPATTIVCYVILNGPFSAATVAEPLPPGAKAPPPSPTGIEIFDAHTGNLLLYSA